jgi:sensor histidine kinase regulating citrate/malate metabolism
MDAGGRPIRVAGTGETPGRTATDRREISLNEEIEGLRMQIEQQKVYIERAEEYQSELRRYRHDRKNNLISLFGILENGDVEGARAYIRDIVGILNQHSSIINTGNPAIDALITEKLAEAEKAGIKVEQIVGLPRDLGINRKDLCLSVGCCMDNAIEACMRARAAGLKPYIRFQLVEVKGIIILKMENATPDADADGLEQLSTSKKDKINHGFGLQNIRSVVDKYHGFMDAAIHDHVFSLDFTLPIE